MNENQQQRLILLYSQQPLVLDRLHHTTEFQELCSKFNNYYRAGFTQHAIYNELLRLRKSKQLPTKVRPRDKKQSS